MPISNSIYIIPILIPNKLVLGTRRVLEKPVRVLEDVQLQYAVIIAMDYGYTLLLFISYILLLSRFWVTEVLRNLSAGLYSL